MRLTALQCRQHAEECVEMAEFAGREQVTVLRRMAETWLQIAEELIVQERHLRDDQNAPSSNNLQ